MTSRDQQLRHMKTRHSTSSKKRTKKSVVSDTDLSVNQMIANNIPVIEAPQGEAFHTEERVGGGSLLPSIAGVEYVWSDPCERYGYELSFGP